MSRTVRGELGVTAHVVDRFREVVARQPDAVAIATAGEPAFTYRELWGRALAIADQLVDTPAIPRLVVAIFMEKSPELVAAMIGTWIAGAAFVPIIPDLPEARRSAIIDETAARVAIVATDRVPSDLRARCRIVDARSGSSGSSGSSVADRAYVIYTSGSTGRPKGVVVPHRGIVNLLDAQIRAFDLRPGDRSLWVLSPSFDASISDVFTALLAGATLHVEHPARLRSPAGLLEVLRQRAITHVDLPPSWLPLLPVADAAPSLRTIVVGGEVCAPAAVRAWSTRVRLVNVYGPTEATVCSTLCVCGPAWSRPLIGRALPNVELRVVDDELWIGGIGVADGYVASPELEAAKFVMRDGTRWFRTGDRVVEHADGEIEFVGRLDRQLKLHGVLVAPEEIEARLREHPSIADAAVTIERSTVRVAAASGAADAEIESEATVLVAYCASRSATDRATPAALRAHLARSLDARILPRRFVIVDNLPRTTSGKVDFAALATHATPRELPLVAGPAEQALAGVWQRVLGVESVGLDDSFFDLGGDSFAVLELVALAEIAGLPLTTEDVYDAPTLAALARRAGEGGRVVARSCADLIADVSPLVAGADSVESVGTPFEPDREEILLTGSTGFLGRHVLAELLARSASVTCIVRAPDDAAARARVSAALDRVVGGAGLRERLDEVTWIAGDLCAPRFGIGDRWAELVERVDTIVHCAADVSLARPYGELRAANVEGTARVLELVAAGRPKRLHYASTLSVFVGGDRDGVLAEDDALESAGRLHGGYAQSKWAAEWLVRRAARSCRDAANTAIYRFGLLTGDTRDGRGAERDWLTWFVRGLAVVGAYPRIAGELRVDVTPIDYASRAMVQLVLDGARGTFHVANPRSATLAEIVAAMRRRGVELREVSQDELVELVNSELLEAVEGASRSSALDPVAALLGACRAGDAYARVRACDVFQASGMTFDTRRTEAALAGSGIACPHADVALLDRYIARMLEVA